jgi:hypothetical protein
MSVHRLVGGPAITPTIGRRLGRYYPLAATPVVAVDSYDARPGARSTSEHRTSEPAPGPFSAFDAPARERPSLRTVQNRVGLNLGVGRPLDCRSA